MKNDLEIEVVQKFDLDKVIVFDRKNDNLGERLKLNVKFANGFKPSANNLEMASEIFNIVALIIQKDDKPKDKLIKILKCWIDELI